MNPAQGHPVIEGVSGFHAGLLHPLFTPAHWLALLALGLLLSQQTGMHRRVLSIVFAAVLLAAIGAIAAAFVFTEGSNVLLAAAVLAGALTALSRPLPLALTAALVAIVASAMQFDSVPQEISAQPTLLSLAGTAVAAWLTVILVAAMAAQVRREWVRIAVRILGSWIAASAMLVLALRMAR
jgi:hydrogenase/urease accessory protein HupE